MVLQPAGLLLWLRRAAWCAGYANYIGQTWLRGYQVTDAEGMAQFKSIYPGWYSGRATHIHFEVFVNGVLKKASQIAFPASISDQVHASPLYYGINNTSNNADNIFGNNAADLTNETIALSGNITDGYTGTLNIRIPL